MGGIPPVKLFLNYFEWISCQGGISPRGLHMAGQRHKDKVKVQTYLHRDDERLLKQAAKETNDSTPHFLR